MRTTVMAMNENIKNLSEQIVSYENNKGVIDDLFGFEARDGFWSKLTKTLFPLASAITGAAITFTTLGAIVGTGTAGLVVAGAAAATVGVISGNINRSVNNNVFSDLHDSHKNNPGKFGHYLGVGLVSASVGIAISAFLPAMGSIAGGVAALALLNIVDPVVQIFSSKGISEFGDKQLRKDSETAREIAELAIQSGRSVEQILNQEQAVKQTPNIISENNPEQTQEKRRSFVKMIEQERINFAKDAINNQKYVGRKV